MPSVLTPDLFILITIPTAMSKPTILLVPGAFLGPNPYATVAQALRDHDYVVDVVGTPSAADLSTESVSSSKWKDLAAQTVESDVNVTRFYWSKTLLNKVAQRCQIVARFGWINRVSRWRRACSV